MRSLGLGALGCVALLSLAACGSDGDAASTTGSGRADSSTVVPTGSTVAGADAATTAPSGGDGGSTGGPIASAKCQQIFVDFGLASSASGASVSDFDGLGKELQGLVPADLSDDATVLIDAYEKIGAVVKDHDGDFDSPEVAQAITALTKSSEFQKASQELGMWFASGCPAG